jgi:hypothetical protein
MRLLAAVLATVVMFAGVGSARALQASDTHAAVRHKPGPVSIRGIVANLRDSGFTLQTTTHGLYTVVTQSQTQVSEKGAHGHVVLANGDHVRVRGFVHGKDMTAITVVIIPVKQKVKPSSLRAVVAAVSGSQLTVIAGGRAVRVKLTPTTRVAGAVTVANKLLKNDRVLVRVVKSGTTLIALSIHVYKRANTGRHVQLHGTLATVSGGSITVVAGGKRYSVAVTGQTAVHEGSASVSIRSLKTGESVTVYACCVPGTLSATSIHILKPRVSVTIQTVRGTVTSIYGTHLSIQSGRETVVVAVGSSTSATLGSSPIAVKNIQVGDQVSVRASKVAAALIARSIHVYVSSRQVHTVDGKVTSGSRAGLNVTTRAGKRYVVSVGRGTAVSEAGKRIPVASIHAGDSVRATGRLSGVTLNAATITVTPAKLTQTTVRGTVVQVAGGVLTIVDSAGKRYVIRAAAGVSVQLKGKTAPPEAMFPGVLVRAKGRLSYGTLVASSIVLGVTARSVSGRVTRTAANRMTVQAARSGSWAIDMAGKVTVADGRKRLDAGNLRTGTYVRVDGYVERPEILRAVHVAVTHPRVSISAKVVSTAGGLVVQTAQGDRYRLKASSSTVISVSRADVAISSADIPLGASVRAQGTVNSDGSVQLSQLAVHLASVSDRGRVTALSPATMSVQTTSSLIQVTIEPATTFFQTVHPLRLTDLVAGDDVTVYGYMATTLLARKVLVHRPRLTLSGTVGTLTSDGFSVTAADGPHHVIVGSATVVVVRAAGQQIVVGEAVRVTGYLRGDGVILATRITITSKP